MTLALPPSLPPSKSDEVQAQILQIARRYQAASQGGIEVINLLGGSAETWMARLPASVRSGLDSATQSALRQALKAASTSRKHVPDQPSWVNSALGAVMGAAGGLGGAGTSLAELPVTTTLLLRIIQGVAQEYGFDPREASVQFDCLSVFSSAGPLAEDDGAETGFLAARMALSGSAVNSIIKVIAPRLGAALGHKLAAQAVPVLGAITGAAINYAYTRYYSEMAHVVFSVRRLSIESGVPEIDLIAALRAQMALPQRG
jgi:hypothetical protein